MVHATVSWGSVQYLLFELLEYAAGEFAAMPEPTISTLIYLVSLAALRLKYDQRVMRRRNHHAGLYMFPGSPMYRSSTCAATVVCVSCFVLTACNDQVIASVPVNVGVDVSQSVSALFPKRALGLHTSVYDDQHANGQLDNRLIEAGVADAALPRRQLCGHLSLVDPADDAVLP